MPVDQQPRSVYIHVPFCIHRCGYCDFSVIAKRDDLVEPFLSGLETEISQATSPLDVDTLFVGGGTPTYLTARQLERLCNVLDASFLRDATAEFTFEANPEGLSPEKMAVLSERGVNRISLGGQSFDDSVLQALERQHTGDQLRAVFSALRDHFENISLDLIFGVPGQSLESWQSTLEAALAMGPQHVSTYGLTFEKGTRFWSRRLHGELQPLSDDIERAMYGLAIDTLTKCGFEQYEISNFARPGRRCRHNMVYWVGLPYRGFGPGASSFVGGRRFSNHRSVTTWMKRLVNGQSPIAESEVLTPEELAREYLVIKLRTCDGVDREIFHAHTRFELDELAGEAIERLARAGFLRDDGSRVQMTHEGRFVADAIVVELV